MKNEEKDILQSLESLVFVIDENDRFAKWYGGKRTPLYTNPEEFIEKPLSSVLPKHLWKKYQDTASLVRKTGLRHGFDYSLTIDEDERWFHVDMELHKDEKSLIAIVDEITAKKRIENAIAERELMYRVLFESANDAIFIMDQSRFVKCNDRTLEMFGCERNQILGKHPFELSPENQPCGKSSRRLALERIHNALNGEPQVFRWVHKRCDSETFNAQVSLNRIQLNGQTLIQAIVRDISEQVKMEKELKESKKKYKTLFEAAPVAVMIIGSSGEILTANESTSTLLGYDANELESRNVKSLYATSDNMREVIQTLTTKGQIDGYEATLKHKDGNTLAIVLDSEPVELADEWVNFVTVRDITKQKEISENLKTAAETANLYLDIMSHDIRNNLQAIMTAGEIIRNRSQDPATKRAIEAIIEAVGNSNAMIHSLHDTEGLLSVDLQDKDLIAVINECTSDLKEEYPKSNIKKHYDVAHAQVQADQYSYDLFHNLIENAIIHNESPEPRVWIHLKEMEAGYLVEVADDGPGFSPSRKEAIFDPKRRFGGVGLHQVKYLVERYGGKINVCDRVENKMNEGTSFVVWLPKANP